MNTIRRAAHERDMRGRSVSLLTAVVLTLVLQLGCSRLNVFSDEPPPEDVGADISQTEQGATAASDEPSVDGVPPPGSEQANAAQPTPASPGAVTAVELLWQVPGETVQKYHLRFGFDQSNLERHVEVATRELETIDDPVHGPLFRYVINGVPANQTVYFTIQAENQYGISPPSPIQQVAPQ